MDDVVAPSFASFVGDNFSYRIGGGFGGRRRESQRKWLHELNTLHESPFHFVCYFVPSFSRKSYYIFGEFYYMAVAAAVAARVYCGKLRQRRSVKHETKTNRRRNLLRRISIFFNFFSVFAFRIFSSFVLKFLVSHCTHTPQHNSAPLHRIRCVTKLFSQFFCFAIGCSVVDSICVCPTHSLVASNCRASLRYFIIKMYSSVFSSLSCPSSSFAIRHLYPKPRSFSFFFYFVFRALVWSVVSRV